MSIGVTKDVGSMGVGAIGEEPRDHVGMLGVRGAHERCGAVKVGEVNVGAARGLCEWYGAGAHGHVEHGLRSFGLRERLVLERRGVARGKSIVERSLAQMVGGVQEPDVDAGAGFDVELREPAQLFLDEVASLPMPLAAELEDA